MSLLSENSSRLCIRCKRHQATRDYPVSEYVSDHLIYEILLRIPAESLLAFKIVCKAWSAIITDPNFARQHRDYHATKDQSIGLVFISETRNIHDFDMTIINKWHESEYVARILGKGPEKPLKVETNGKSLVRFVSCNGLICFYTDYPLLICNPLTREFVTLPKPKTQKGKEMRTGCGFGYDATRNEYKAVQIYCRFDDSTLEYQVLTLGTTMSWIRPPIQQEDKLIHPVFFQNELGQESIFVEGSIYWHANEQILCFDVTMERFKLIDLTKMYTMWLGDRDTLVELGKSLCFTSYDFSSRMLHICKMQKDSADEENIWKEDSIDVSCLIIPETFIQHCYIQPVCSRSNKMYLRYGNGLACYDSESQDPVAPVVLYRLGAHDNRFDFVAYTKSIVCLKDIVGPSVVSILSDS